MARNDEREFRLRPRKPSVGRKGNEAAAWAVAFKTVMHFARTSRGGTHRKSSSARSAVPQSKPPRSQRCAIRVTYTRNAVRGQWRAHGHYIARGSAAGEHTPGGFNGSEDGIEASSCLAAWQSQGDERLWKMIVSPEFGDRVDLRRLTRDLMHRVEADLGTPLEWVAVTHHNTEHPHVHVALRGVDSEGRGIHLKRDYLKHGIRLAAEDLCTRQIGHRTDLDAMEAERREIQEKRYTSLDRFIGANKQAEPGSASVFHVAILARGTPESETAQVRRHHIAARLAVLEKMGLATRSGPVEWFVRNDFESTLRAMQRTGDRQKMLASHGALMSDERLQTQALDFRTTSAVEGRVLVHGEDEQTGRSYLMLEGTDARVHFIVYTPEIEAARSRGQLRTNSFARLRRIVLGDKATVTVEDLGLAEAILGNRQFLRAKASDAVKTGAIPDEDGWGGWLGRYQSALHKAAIDLEYPRANNLGKKRDRSNSR